MENATLIPFDPIRKFWKKINPLKLWRHSKEARHVAFIRAMAGLAAKVAKSDGQVSEQEIRVFKKIFVVKEEETSYVAKTYNDAKKNIKGIEKYAAVVKDICAGNLEMQESVVENLFKIAVADGKINNQVLELLKKISLIVGLPEGNFEIIRDLYLPKVKSKLIQDYYDVLGVLYTATDAEIKARWKKLIIQYHPDRQQAKGASPKEIEVATAKMAEINFAYQEIVKMRGGK
jgi:DnaJ like chaperone protein